MADEDEMSIAADSYELKESLDEIRYQLNTDRDTAVSTHSRRSQRQPELNNSAATADSNYGSKNRGRARGRGQRARGRIGAGIAAEHRSVSCRRINFRAVQPDRPDSLIKAPEYHS